MPRKQEPTKQEENNTGQAEEKPKLRSVIWRGDGEAHKQVQIGMLTIELPNADEQRKGFETEHARLLVTSISGFKYLK